MESESFHFARDKISALIKSMKTRFALITVLAISSILTACQRPKQDTATVSIQIPKRTVSSHKSASQSVRAQNVAFEWGESYPSSIDEVNCYAIMVSGEGVSGNGKTCSNYGGAQVLSGQIFSGFHKPGQVIQLDIEPGPARSLTVVGLKARAGVECPNGLEAGFNKKDYSAPVVIGSRYQSIVAGENQVSIEISLNNPQYIFNCGWENVSGPISVSSVEPAYPNHANWNEYVIRDFSKADAYAQSDVVCAGTETSSVASPCIHGGDKRIVKITGTNSCTGLTAEDSQGAFHWTCKSSGSGVEFRSSGFKSGKGLKDLLDSASFKPMQVTVYKDGAYVNRSGYASWWSNPVETTIANSGSVLNLTEEGKIYRIEGSGVGTVNIMASRVGLVLGSAAKSSNPTVNDCNGRALQGCSVGAKDVQHVWVEGLQLKNTGANADAAGLFLKNVKMSQVHNVNVGNYQIGLGVVQSEYNSFTNVTAARSGVALSASHVNSFYGLNVNNATTGLSVSGSNNNNFSFVQASFNNEAIEVIGSLNNTFNAVSALTNSYRHLHINAGQANTFNNLLVLGGTTYGLYLDNTDAFTLSNASIDGAGIAIAANNATSSMLKGLINIGPNGSACTTGGTTSGIANGYCGTNDATKTLTTDDITNALVGKATAQDSKNASNSAGVSTATGSLIADLFNFDNPFRSWGFEAASFHLVPGGSWFCSDFDICNIWDSRIRSTDTTLKNRIANFVAGAGCPVAATKEYQHVTGLWALQNAVEIASDSVGNDNGLCESNEKCILTTNIGAYQGEGSLSQSCLFSPTPNVSDVELVTYSQNGI